VKPRPRAGWAQDAQRIAESGDDEIQKTRPCLIVSPSEMHDHLRAVIVAPMTTGSRPTGFRVPLTFKGQDGQILLDQIRTVDKQRLVKRLVADPIVVATLDTLREAFQL
jgi:mRNA interferase MazF